jgi:hypothetical protein
VIDKPSNLSLSQPAIRQRLVDFPDLVYEDSGISGLYFTAHSEARLLGPV